MTTRGAWRSVAVVLLAVVVSATVLAQRGGFGGFGGRRRSAPVFAGNTPYDGRFTFVRMSYEIGFGGFGRQGPPWSHDYPTGEAHFMNILTAVSSVSGHVDETNILAFDDPEMFKYPLIYLVEPGYWNPTDEQVTALHDYLVKGGFLIVDDFPSWAWPNFEQQMSRVFPKAQWHLLNDLPDHPIFHTFYEVDANAMPTYYDLGGRPLFQALFEDNDPSKRMQVIANYQNDISEYWEFSETGFRPVDESNEAYKFGVNEFIYGITH